MLNDLQVLLNHVIFVIPSLLSTPPLQECAEEAFLFVWFLFLNTQEPMQNSLLQFLSCLHALSGYTPALDIPQVSGN